MHITATAENNRVIIQCLDAPIFFRVYDALYIEKYHVFQLKNYDRSYLVIIP